MCSLKHSYQVFIRMTLKKCMCRHGLSVMSPQLNTEAQPLPTLPSVQPLGTSDTIFVAVDWEVSIQQHLGQVSGCCWAWLPVGEVPRNQLLTANWQQGTVWDRMVDNFPAWSPNGEFRGQHWAAAFLFGYWDVERRPYWWQNNSSLLPRFHPVQESQPETPETLISSPGRKSKVASMHRSSCSHKFVLK